MTDELTLLVGGRALSGWTDVRVTRGIERLPSDFQISFTELQPDEANVVSVQAGDTCQVFLGDDLTITGYIDRFVPGYTPTGHEIHVSGRGKCCDLVDCAAEWPGGQIVGSNALEVAQKLSQPYGIRVSAGVDPGPRILQFNLNLGETPYEIIERICRYSALLAYDMPDGNLYLSQAGAGGTSTGIAEGMNVQSAHIEYSANLRYSEYVAFLQRLESLHEGGDGNELAIVNDPTVHDPPRHRRMVIISEQAYGGEEVAKKRAVWECARRFARSNVATVRVDSWRDANGKLWAPNLIVPLSLPKLKLPSVEWLIGEVTYLRNGSDGTCADLTLMPAEGFVPQPVLPQAAAAETPALGPVR